MKINNIDKNVKEKLENRVFQPSASAWERLSAQLDEQPQQKKKGWFFYIGYAASILLLISVGIYFFSDDEQVINRKTIIVDTPIDTSTINKNIDAVFKEIIEERAIVNNEKVEKEEIKKNIDTNKSNNFISKKENLKIKKKIAKIEPKKVDKSIIAKVEESTNTINLNSKESLKNKTENQQTKSSITINPEDLLYAVTHTKTEVKEYYAKYDVKREDLLKTIQSELKKSNLKVNPETILAEVERTIDDDFFKNNFLNTLKKKVTDIASVIASRND